MEVVGTIFQYLEQYSWLGNATNLVHMPTLDEKIEYLGVGLGLPLIMMKYMLALFLVYPMAYILRVLPNPTLKHVYSFLGGLYLMQWIYGPNWIHSMISTLITYMICAFFPGKYQHIVVFVFVMSFMTACHIYRMYVAYMSDEFDFTGTQMVFTMKLTSFAYNLYDGTVDRKNVFGTHADEKKSRLYSSRKKYAITQMPSFLEFMGYVYCFTCVLAGPAFEFTDYQRSITGEAFKRTSNTTPKKSDSDNEIPTKVVATVPSSLVPSILCLLKAIACMGLYLYLNALFPLPRVAQADFVATHTIPERLLFTLIATFAFRQKYYFAWKLAEAASIMGGFGFTGYSSATDSGNSPASWRGVENIDILNFEMANNTQSLTRSWNKRTQGWLERYTYGRTGNSLLATYFISALWHGLYPGYFVFFMFMPVLTTIERHWRKKMNPLFIPGYDGRNYATAPQTLFTKFYFAMCTVCTFIAVNFVVQTFPLGSWENCNRALGSYYWGPHVTLTLIAVILSIIPGPKSSKEKKNK